jgi:hypothetical protein
MNGIKKIGAFLKRLPAFGIADIAPTIMAVGIAAIIGAVLLIIVTSFQSQPGISAYCANILTPGTVISYGNSCAVSAGNVVVKPTSYNALSNATSSVGNIFAQLPLLGTVIGLVLVLGVVLYFFYRQGKGNEGL